MSRFRVNITGVGILPVPVVVLEWGVEVKEMLQVPMKYAIVSVLATVSVMVVNMVMTTMVPLFRTVVPNSDRQANYLDIKLPKGGTVETVSVLMRK